MTALGAFGFGALGVGPAFSQEMPAQIPAPRLFDDIAKCQGVARMAQGTARTGQSPLDVILEGTTGTPVVRTTADADIDATQRTALLTRLSFPATDGDGKPACMNALTGDAGYDRAIELYEAWVDANEDLPREDDDPNVESNLERAARLAEADLNAFRGEVYNEVIEVLMAEKEVTDAIEAYNDLVGTDGRLAALTTAYNDINVTGTGLTDDDDNPLDADALDRLFGEDELQGFQAIEGTAFDDEGRLQLEEVASTDIDTLGEIQTELQTRANALRDASMAVTTAENEGNLNLAPLQEAERRARVAHKHVEDELKRLTAVLRAHNQELGTAVTITPTGGDPINLATDHRELISGFGNINNRVDKAAETLETTVKALDTANNDARKAFGDAKSYLDQLVTLRKFDEAKAEAALADAGDDPAPSLVADADDAEKLRIDAEGTRETYLKLVGDPDNQNPANELLSALLAQEDANTDVLEDDDGKALVDAVAKTFETADSAMTTADANEDRLDDLLQTADDGTETGRIASIEESIKGLTGDDGTAGKVDLTAGKVDLLETGLADLAGDGQTDETVKGNADDIGLLDTRVAANEKGIGDLEVALYGPTASQHDGPVCEGSGIAHDAACGKERSGQNAEAIGDLDSDVEELSGRVDEHDTKLWEKKAYIETLQGEVGIDAMGNGTEDNGMSRID
ncbi:MAG: hypothetical protein OXB98_07635, partial [Bryobacterales bacterium]|nr:hypothetical protein [Bryobacterales bacterium]